MSADAEAPVFTTAELERDPHAIYAAWRPRRPFITRQDGVLIVLQANAVRDLASDSRTRQIETDFLRLRGVTSKVLNDFIACGMLHSNGADHRRRRGPVSRAFAFKIIEQLRPQIRQITEAAFAPHAAAGTMNLLDDYAAVIPATVIARILGLPASDIPHFTTQVYTIARLLGHAWTAEDLPAIEAATSALLAYVRQAIEDRRAAPQDDFLSAYVQAVGEGGELSPLEEAVQIAQVIIGGSDTTRAAMVIQVALLLQHAGQWQAVCDDPALIPKAVEEALRFEPSVGSFPRAALEEVEIDGHTIPKGALLLLSTLSAMRDEAVYADPQTFDIRRDGPRLHPVFGSGPHRCLGEALARMELEEGLATLARHAPGLHVVGPWPLVSGHAGIRRVSAMSVAWS